MRIIDLDSWNRKKQYETFIGYTDPIFSVTTRLDVTELVGFCKKNDRSFFPSFLYFLMRAINGVKEMRIRIKDGVPVLYDRVDPSYIVICREEQLASCENEAIDDFDTFYRNVRKTVDSTKIRSEIAGLNPKPRLDCVYISCLPWIDVTSVKNPYNLADAEQSSIPRILWGKYVKNAQERYEMSFDIAAHHALIDGAQLCRVMQDLQNALNDPEKIINGG
jgi:chloramphenicol O-acetyltransferase